MYLAAACFKYYVSISMGKDEAADKYIDSPVNCRCLQLVSLPKTPQESSISLPGADNDDFDVTHEYWSPVRSRKITH